MSKDRVKFSDAAEILSAYTRGYGGTKMTYETWAREYLKVDVYQTICTHELERTVKHGLVVCQACQLPTNKIEIVERTKAAWDAAKRSGSDE